MNTKKSQAIGLIGLGQAGISLATALLRRFDLIGYDLNADRCAIAGDAGVHIAASSAAVADACEIVLLSLPTPQASRSAALKLAQGQIAGRLVIETSTVSPEDIDWLSAFFATYQATVMDSAIVGGVHKLAAGKTTFLVGGSHADFARAKPVLDVMAEEIFHLGAAGSGMRAKLINNAIAHTTMVTLLEGAALASKAGVPIDLYYKLLRRESGLLRPLTHRIGERVMGQDFEGGMNTANARKDSALAIEFANKMGVPLFTMQASHSVYEMAVGEGLGALDYASISKLWERWLCVSFKGTVQKE